MFAVYISGKHYANVITQTKWEAIDRAYYQKGGSAVEINRNKYKAKRV